MRELLRRPPVFLASLLLLSLLVFLANVRSARRLGPVPRAVLWTVAYPQVLLSRSIEGVRTLWEDYLYLVDLTKKYEAAQVENARLRSERARLMDMAMENARLKKLLDFKEREAGRLLPARVIGESGETTSVLTIDRGGRDGIRPELAVVSYEGLIGRTAEVTPWTAQVILLQDPRSRAPARTLRSRARGIVAGRGPGELLVFDRVRRTEDVEPGDELVTSGTGVLFPKGIPVGTVTDVRRSTYGLLQQVWVAPAVDFTRIEEVLVILEADEPAFEPPAEPERGT